MNLSETTRAYQTYLETLRTIREEDFGGDHDIEFTEQMADDLEKARREMELAWLESLS